MICIPNILSSKCFLSLPIENNPFGGTESNSGVGWHSFPKKSNLMCNLRFPSKSLRASGSLEATENIHQSDFM